MKIVGLTGNIGAGKSTISLVFKELGITVFDSDWEGKKLLLEDEKVRFELKKCFGEAIFTEMKPDPKKIASIVFKNQTALEALNGIIHPRVKEEFELWIKNQRSPIVIKEAAIMVESNSHLQLDALIMVTCNTEERISRVMKRDGVTREQVLERIARQMPEEEKLNHAQFIINNNGNEMIIPQVLNVLKQLQYVSA